MQHCDHFREQIAFYCVSVLEPDEQVELEQHLKGCPECQQLVQEYREALTMLPQALMVGSDRVMPTTLKNRVLQSITEPAYLPAQQATTGEGRHASRRILPLPKAKPSASPQPSARRRLQSFANLAALLIAIIALAWGTQLNAALAHERALREEYAQLLSQQQELVIEVLDSPQSTKSFLRPTQAGSRAYGKLFTRADLPHVVIMAARLPEPPENRVYQVWLTQAGQAQLAGELTFHNGFGILVFDAPQAGPVYEAAQLVAQPRSSTTLTSTPIIQWQAQP